MLRALGIYSCDASATSWMAAVARDLNYFLIRGLFAVVTAEFSIAGNRTIAEFVSAFAFICHNTTLPCLIRIDSSLHSSQLPQHKPNVVDLNGILPVWPQTTLQLREIVKIFPEYSRYSPFLT